MLIIGLTGGIASGKSTISASLKARGFVIIDLDQIAKDVVTKGSSCFNKIVSAFGNSVLDPNGDLDRKALGELVFTSAEKRRTLNAIMRPYLATALLKTLFYHFLIGTPRVVLDAPLLIETGLHRICSKVIVISLSPEAQLKRLMLRNEFSESEARSRIAAQMPTEAKLKHATDVIDNSGTVEELHKRTDEIAARLEKESSLFNRVTVAVGIAFAFGAVFYYIHSD